MMASLLTAIAYQTIVAFLIRTKTPEHTAQRRIADDANHQQALAAEKKRGLISASLARGQATKRRREEAEAEVNAGKKRRVLNLDSGFHDKRPDAQEHVRTARNHKMFCIKENAILVRKGGSDYVNPKALSRPNPEDDLLSDKLEGLKLVFFVYHGSNAPVAASMIKDYVPEESKTRKDMMSRLKAERARLQSRLFTKARAICQELTESEDFAELYELELQKMDRIRFFKSKATQNRVSDFYTHVASAVDLALIFNSQKDEYMVIQRFMKAVFVKTMEDIWKYELHPDKQDAHKKVAKANTNKLFESFRNLTNAQGGLPIMKELPSYLDIPVTPGFPRRRHVLPKRTLLDDDLSLYDDIDPTVPAHDDSW